MEKELCKLFKVPELIRITIEHIDKIDIELQKEHTEEEREELLQVKKNLEEIREIYAGLKLHE